MKYTTKNEWEHFEYQDAHISEVQLAAGFFRILLDGVVILPENSANRDIRRMRANELLFRVEGGEVLSFTQEGYKVYDADGKLQRQYEDTLLDASQYEDAAKQLADGYVYSLERRESEDGYVYTFVLDGTDEHTYDLVVRGRADVQEWDRFLNLE